MKIHITITALLLVLYGTSCSSLSKKNTLHVDLPTKSTKDTSDLITKLGSSYMYISTDYCIALGCYTNDQMKTTKSGEDKVYVTKHITDFMCDCVSDRASKGNSLALELLFNYIDEIKNSDEIFTGGCMTLRGEKIFNKLIEMSYDFRVYYGEIGMGSLYGGYPYTVATNMIDNVDGMSYYDYSKLYYKDRLSEVMANWGKEYNAKEISLTTSILLLEEAYQNGKIVLKK